MRISIICWRVYAFGAKYHYINGEKATPLHYWISMIDHWNVKCAASRWIIQRNLSNTQWRRIIGCYLGCHHSSGKKSLARIDFVIQLYGNSGGTTQRTKLNACQVWLDNFKFYNLLKPNSCHISSDSIANVICFSFRSHFHFQIPISNSILFYFCPIYCFVCLFNLMSRLNWYTMKRPQLRKSKLSGLWKTTTT